MIDALTHSAYFAGLGILAVSYTHLDVYKRQGRERVFTIVGGAESDVAAGKISNESPVGAALLGHKKGDVIKTTGPTGRDIEMEIQKIEH